MKLEELYESLTSKSGTFYYTPRRDKLPYDMVDLFDRLGKQQRNIPERVMNDITRKYPLMWFGNLLEHLGDLIHAFADAVNYDGMIMRDVDRKLKVASMTLSNLNANVRDLAEQNEIEAQRRGISPKQYTQEIMRALDKYSEAHFKLPAYNEVHVLCKRITTSLGAMQFEECKRHVDTLLRYENDGSLNKRALTITRNSQGKIIEVRK